jgi:hypothetical protein
VQLIAVILYIVFIVQAMISEIRSFIHLKMKYFRRFRSLLELIILLCSLACIGIYFWRLHETNRLSTLFRDTHGDVYVNLQSSVHLDDLLISLLGFASFFTTLRFAHLFEINARISLFVHTLHHATQYLIYFSLEGV